MLKKSHRSEIFQPKKSTTLLCPYRLLLTVEAAPSEGRTLTSSIPQPRSSFFLRRGGHAYDWITRSPERWPSDGRVCPQTWRPAQSVRNVSAQKAFEPLRYDIVSMRQKRPRKTRENGMMGACCDRETIWTHATIRTIGRTLHQKCTAFFSEVQNYLGQKKCCVYHRTPPQHVKTKWRTHATIGIIGRTLR